MTIEEINSKVKGNLEEQGLPSPVRCIKIKGDEVWFEFTGDFKLAKNSIFKAISLLTLYEFKEVNKVILDDLHYSRIELERDLLMARIKSGI